MDIQVFIRRRKEKGLSQIELSHGICTQATLSRFENHGQIPSMKILSQLCARLQLDVGDLFASVNTKEVAINKLLEKIEESIVTMDYELAEKLIGTVQLDQLNDEQKIHLLYLRGFTQVLQGKEMEDDLFYFNKILAEQYENDDTYIHLAYTGLGLVYHQQKDIEKAEYYFSKAIHESEKHQLEKMEDVWRVLMVLYHSAMFFSNNKNYYILSIRDEGRGIAPENINKIFERFHKTNINNNGGTGLGLAIAHQIALRHNIKIDVKSKENIGTTFTFYLPNTPED